MIAIRSCRSLRGYATLVAAVVATAGATVSADVIDFDDLGASPGGTHMPSTYASFRWGTSNWHFMTVAARPSDTFLALSGTATFIGSVASPGFVGGPDFYFDGADFWSRRGADANGDFSFVLYHDGVTVYNGREDRDGRQRFNGVAQRLVPSYIGPVDGFAIAFDNDDWDHLAMDNVRIRWIESVCRADLSGSSDPNDPSYGVPDGIADASDFFYYLDQFAAGNLSAADLTGSADSNDPSYGSPDGAIDASDFFYFLDLVAAGCP